MHSLSPKNVVAPHSAAAFYRTLALELIGGQIPTATGSALGAIDLGLILNFVGYQTISSPQVSVMLQPTSTLLGEIENAVLSGSHVAKLFSATSAWQAGPIFCFVNRSESSGTFARHDRQAESAMPWDV